MLRAASVVRKPAVKAEKVIDTVVLDHDGRHKRRILLSGKGGTAFLMDLDKATVLDDGDALKLEDGRLIAVEAAPEKLLEITAENPLRLLRTAWHIGNRHTPAEITAEAIYIEDDHVLAEMIRGQGCAIRHVERPFRPERGAYDHGHAHAHDHDHAHGASCGCGHDHGHDHHHHDHEHGHAHAAGGSCCGGAHAHGHEHAHDHGHGHEHEHEHEHHANEHGSSCGCGHDHGHGHHHHDHKHG